MRHTFSLARDVSSTREYPRFVAPIELDQHHRCVLASTVTYSRCLRWCRVCHDVIRGDVADEEEEKVEKNKKGKDASLQPQEVTIFRVSSLYRVDHREWSQALYVSIIDDCWRTIRFFDQKQRGRGEKERNRNKKNDGNAWASRRRHAVTPRWITMTRQDDIAKNGASEFLTTIHRTYATRKKTCVPSRDCDATSYTDWFPPTT